MNKAKKYLRLAGKIFFLLFSAIILLLVVCNAWVYFSTRKQVYYSIEEAPYRSVALVLGTSNKLVSGKPNPFFTNRIEKAKALIEQNKVSHIIVSGDNRSKYYNEPSAMKKALVQKGVQQQKITLDFAGLRTFDSIVRCKEIFGQDSITIITQSFHTYRALFISNYYQIDAVAVVAEEPGRWQSVKVIMREFLARPLAVLDLYILNTEPKFLGKKEKLNGL
ncbi:MAG: YdcF family protein [Cyclobacteriaceae bacterium]|jgi:SanA protein|nr:YdcF family protein [Cyclobacteriaceae bacterium]